jgi:hypothetical protein
LHAVGFVHGSRVDATKPGIALLLITKNADS